MSDRRIVDTPDGHEIRPEDIDASEHLWNTFDHTETEISAGWIIRFFQERGMGWQPFTREEINAFYQRKYNHEFVFNRLVEPEMIPPSLVRAFAGHRDPLVPAGGGWIVLGDDGRYRVTDDFIERCHRSSPIKAAL